MDNVRGSGDHVATPNGAMDVCEDGCSICLEDFSQYQPSTVTNCKHEFHLHCILEWYQRSSNCPMCWQTINLKDASSQQLLEDIEHQRILQQNLSRNPTTFYQLPLPLDIREVDLEEHIFQHLASVAIMRRRHYIFQREAQRTRSFSSQSASTSQNEGEPSDIQSLSESVRSRINLWSTRYRESIYRNTRGWKEMLLAQSTSMANLSAEVRREVNNGIAGVSRMMERLDSTLNNLSNTIQNSQE